MITSGHHRTILAAVTLTLALFSFVPEAPAQSATPTPAADQGSGDYKVTASVELGVRGLEVNGDHEKYRSDQNYRAGLRLFDSSILIEDNRSQYRAFDSALFQSGGWGSDPTGYFRANLDKVGIYKLDTSVRRVRYFNNLKNHVPVFSQPVSRGSQHRANTLHDFGDADLTIFPERDFRIRLGYGFNRTEGPGTSTLRFRSDEFQVDSQIRNRSDDYRAGVEGKLLGFNLGLLYGHRAFRDDTQFLVSSFNPGNNLGATTSFLTSASRDFNVVGHTNFINFFFQRTFAEKLDLSGRFIHSQSDSEIVESDILIGRVSATGDFITSDEIRVPGIARRPQSRGDLGVTWRATSKFRISNTFTFDQFSVGGSNTLAELVSSTSSAGVPRANAFTNSFAWRSTSYRRFSNLIEGDYQFNRRLAVNLGYRYGHREVGVFAIDRNLLSAAPVTPRSEELDNTTHSIIAGARINPATNWSIWMDLERGESDNVFTRLSNNDTFSFRARTRGTVKQFTFSASGIFKNNDSPGVSVPILNNQGVVIFPATETIADTRQRIFTAEVDWNPAARFGFSGGYTYTHLTSDTDIIVPVGTPIFPTTQFLLGRSEFFVRDSYFHFDVNAKPVKRLTLYASYRFNDDRGQGDRLITRPQDMIYSYPMKSHIPELKLAWRVTRNIDWNVGYQYYSYRERSQLNPFAVPAVLLPAQNYTAHMPYTSIRVFFGGESGAR